MPFLSSISLIFFLVMILFGLSSARIGGWTWIMRHRGSAVGSWGVMRVCVGFDGFGKVVWVDFAGAAATAAHDSRELVAIGVDCVVGSRGCCCVVWVWFASSLFSFLVKYTLVSQRYTIVGSTGLFVSSSFISS